MRRRILIAVAAALLVGVPAGAAAATRLDDSSPSGVSTGAATPSAKALWQRGFCAGCHTMKAARATGTIGPNLDRSKPSRALVIKRVTFGKGAMPSFRRQFNKAQIAAIATFVANNT